MTFKVTDAAGVAVYEMPVIGEINDAVLAAFAEEAMQAAAATVTHGARMGKLDAEYHVPVAGARLRAEAIVMARRGTTLRMAADIMADGNRIASFEGDAVPAAA
jgi:acyl-coenzyme A thioesterase PaaI-like protein